MIYLAERSEGGPASTMSPGCRRDLAVLPPPSPEHGDGFLCVGRPAPSAAQDARYRGYEDCSAAAFFRALSAMSSILCGYEADVSSRQLQESHYAMSTASIING